MHQPKTLRPLGKGFLLLVFALAMASCDACYKWPKCNNDKHCRADKADNETKKQFYCINGTCKECRNEKDCGEKQKCESNACVDKTCADIQCSDGKRCDPATLTCKWICENDGESPCDGDVCKVCKKHQCIAKPPPCTQDTDCPGQQICKVTGSGSCERACVGGCSASKPCPSGQKCQAGKCVQDTCEMAKAYYDFNRAYIRSDAKTVLQDNLKCIQKTTGKKLLITGHCDERGTREYNIRLGERRAKAARAYLMKLGVKRARFCGVVSKGKEEPVVSGAASEEDHQKNRRAVFEFVESCP
ncbi:MAG: OmpA family protein [Myxococcota bacterium]